MIEPVCFDGTYFHRIFNPFVDAEFAVGNFFLNNDQACCITPPRGLRILIAWGRGDPLKPPTYQGYDRRVWFKRGPQCGSPYYAERC